MGEKLVALIALCGSTACTSTFGFEPELFVGPGEVALIDYSLNGDLGCDGGAIIVEPTGSVNGSIDAVDCKVTLRHANNGHVAVTGGELLHIENTTTINGSLDAVGVDEVIIVDTGFNGDAYIEDSYSVTVLSTSLNGDLIIKNAQRCVQDDNNARAIVMPQSCVGPL